MAVDGLRFVRPEPACRGNIVATVISSDASYASAKPDKTDDLDADGRIWTPGARFRSVSRQLGGGSSPLIRISAS
jgi:hypothetical protein